MVTNLAWTWNSNRPSNPAANPPLRRFAAKFIIHIFQTIFRFADKICDIMIKFVFKIKFRWRWARRRPWHLSLCGDAALRRRRRKLRRRPRRWTSRSPSYFFKNIFTIYAQYFQHLIPFRRWFRVRNHHFFFEKKTGHETGHVGSRGCWRKNWVSVFRVR